MNKKYLETGMYVVLRDGSVCVTTVLSKTLTNIHNGCYVNLDSYDDNLKHLTFNALDVVKVYDNYEMKKTIWKEFTLTDDEKTILRNLPEDYKYIARDNPGSLYIFKLKPIKEDNECWMSNGWSSLCIFNHLFQFIKWDDYEPYLISELLES